MSFANIFSQITSDSHLLALLTVSFAGQKLFDLMKSQEFILALASLAFGDVPTKKLLLVRSKSLLPVLSSRILMDSFLTLCFFIHFQSIFMYGVRKWSNFIFLHVAVQFSQHHLLKRLSLFHRTFLPALLTIS